MKKRFKALSLLLIFALLFSLSSTLCFAASEEERAERFLAVAARLDDCAGILDREAVYLEAMSDDVYFDDTSYDGVAEALAALEEVGRQIALSVEFVVSVDGLSDAAEEGYVALRALLDRAAECYGAITDKGYTGVSGAYKKYISTLSDLVPSERFTEDIVSRKDELAASETYGEKKYIIEDIEYGMSDEQFISDYPGVAELLSEIALAEAYMREATIKANSFIAAQESIHKGEGYIASLLAAYIALKGVDTTVRGVGAVKNEFREQLDAYNRDVREINAVFG